VCGVSNEVSLSSEIGKTKNATFQAARRYIRYDPEFQLPAGMKVSGPVSFVLLIDAGEYTALFRSAAR
jgi:hypothetical protein